MQSKTLSFSKIEKTITKIDTDLNNILKDVTFKFATQNQSYSKGKMVVTLFFEPKAGKIRAKSFKDQNEKKLDELVNDFISDKKVVFTTQTFIGSSIYTIVFYSIEEKIATPPTPPTGTTATPPVTTETVTVVIDKSVTDQGNKA